MPGLSAERLSELIGSIYDCTIDPARWPQTLKDICAATRCMASVLQVVDLRTSDHHFIADWNISPETRRVFLERFTQPSADLYRTALGRGIAEIDEPLSNSRSVGNMDAFRQSPMYREWAEPAGYYDAMSAIVLRKPDHVGALAVMKSEAEGLLTDDDIAALRLLAPHLRRAVTISDLMNLKALKAQALAATLDAFTMGVVLVDADAMIVHANDEAWKMMRNGSPILSSRGRIASASPDGSAQLWRAIEMAAGDEASLGGAGIGMRLARRGERPATAHVLPLSRGELRNRLLAGAAAAVFVASGDRERAPGVAAVAQAFNLTKAEAQVLELIAAGRTPAQAAAELEIAEATAKTHLAHIFSKTGVSRQADLIRLVMTLVPPVKSE